MRLNTVITVCWLEASNLLGFSSKVKVRAPHARKLANCTDVWLSKGKKRILRFRDFSQRCGHREQALLFHSLRMDRSLSQPHSSLWQSQQVASAAWMDSEGSPSLQPPPPTPSALCDWQGWQAALKIRPSCASQSVPGKLLSYASVMVCSPGYLLVSLRLWSVFTEQVRQLGSQAAALDLTLIARGISACRHNMLLFA